VAQGIKAVFFAANPRDTTTLELGKEFRAINKVVRAATYRDWLDIIPAFSTRTSDLQPTLTQHLPHIVHFSGHGSAIGEILAEDPDGDTHPLPPRAVRRLFEVPYHNNVRLVLLNACYSRIQAEAIVEVVDCAIGMNAAVPDFAAIVFAEALYGAIAEGLSVAEAFEQGKSELEIEGLLGESRPELLTRQGVDAKEIYLIRPGATPPAVDPTAKGTSTTRGAKVGTVIKSGQKQVSLAGTNPTGRSYLSYQRSRVEEARLLIAAQHDRGIPTHQALIDLPAEEPEKSITRTLADSGTANAILWLTPRLKSNPLRLKEVSAVFERTAQDRDEAFFVQPLLPAGVELRKLKPALDTLTFEQLQDSKPRTIKASSIDAHEASEIARLVLEKRLSAIHKSLPEGEPLRVQFYTRAPVLFAPGTALLLDWTHRFDGGTTTSHSWQQFLLPALEDIAEAVQEQAFERTIEVSGVVTIPAAIAFGSVFRATRGLNVVWRQRTPAHEDQLWTLDAPREPSGFRAQLFPLNLKAKDVAVVVSVDRNLDLAFNATRDNLPQLCAVIHVQKPGTHRIGSLEPGQAVDVAELVIEALVRARTELQGLGRVHLLMAVPFGLAMMIGQLLHSFESVQTYDDIPDHAVRHYRPAALLQRAANTA
jgi:hypothetical protein